MRGLPSMVMPYDNVGTVFTVPASRARPASGFRILGRFDQGPWGQMRDRSHRHRGEHFAEMPYSHR